MMNDVDLAVRFVIATLLAGLWQAPLFALAAWVVLRLNASANATTRHSVLAAALFASLILPLATAALAMHPGASVSAFDSGNVALPKGARSYVPVDRAPSLPKHTRVPQSTTPPALAVDTAHSIAIPSIARFNLSLPRWLALAIVGIWFVSAALVLTRLALSLSHLERLKRDALPLDVGYRSGLTRWAVATKGSRNVRLCIADDIDIPIAVGLFDAMILVPKRLLDELAPHEIDAIVLHELAHLRRSDDWINAVERIASALLFFNPGIIWLASQLDLEREVACDDWVLQQNDALPYATCLAKVAETAMWPHRPMTAPGAFVTRRGMSIRIERLLAKKRDVRIRTSFGLASTAVVLLGVLGLVAAFVSPSVAYDATQQPATLAAMGSPRPGTEHSAERVRPLHGRESFVSSHEAAVSQATRERIEPGTNGFPSHVNVPIVHVPVVRFSPNRIDVNGSHGTVASIDAGGHHIAVSVPATAGAHSYDDPSSSENSVSSDSPDPTPPPVPQPPAALKNEKQLMTDASSPDYIDELKSVGYTNLTIDQLVQLKAVGVDANFIRGFQKNGLSHPSVEELTKLRTIGIEPSYVGEMRKRYGNSLGIDDIVGLRMVGADPAYVGAMRRRFGDSLSLDQIAGLRTVGVTSSYCNELAAAGVSDLTPEHATSLRALGVTPEYIRELARAGYPRLSTDEIQQLRALGIDGDFIDRAERHGFHHAGVEQLVKLKATGVL